MTHTHPWGTLDLPPGASTELAIGSLHVEVRRTPYEIWLRCGRGPDTADLEDWRRWSIPDDAELQLRPASPDRLLVVSHEYPFQLPGRRSARIFTRVPLFVQIVASGADIGDIVVMDEPSLVLSDTWWGTVQEGELAYWLSTTARAEVTDDLFVPHAGMCPVQLENVSGEALPVDRFALRAQHLTLFDHGHHIWTDEVRVRYHAKAEGSEIDFAGRPPAEAPGATPLARPRIAVRRGLHARTFDRLRSLSMLGG